MKTVAYEPEHLVALSLQPAQRYLGDFVTPDYARALAKYDAYSVLDNDEKVIACAGVLPQWRDRAFGWSFIAADAGRHFLYIHRSVSAFLDGVPVRRIETTVDCEFAAGHRWARLLGFMLEAERMRGYRVDGGDCALYARVR